MGFQTIMRERRNVGFISTRLAGTDGVSLETDKWAQVLERMGHSCFFLAGELDTPPERSFLVPEMHFRHPDIRAITQHCFANTRRSAEVSRRVQELKNFLKEKLAEFVRRFDLDLLVPENAMAIPVNIPLGLALTEHIMETRCPVIAHHHDFFWERKRFLTNAAWDYLAAAFPPKIPGMAHVVINSSASNQIALRRGIAAAMVPNVMDFDRPAPGIDDYNRNVPEEFGLEPGEKFILQPTRVVKRKGIEHAIELLHRLDRPARLVISHASGDEGDDYERRVREYADLMRVKVNFVSDIIADQRGRTADGRKIYTIQDIYPHADLVTYPSTFEGFGNAFLEAIWFRKPIVVNNYSVYSFDIKPKGFETIEFDGFITDEVVSRARAVLDDPACAEPAAAKNLALGRRFYSFTFLEQELKTLIYNCFGSETEINKR